MTNTNTLLKAFTKAAQDFHTSQLQMFEDDMMEYASKLIIKHGVSPQKLNDIYKEITG